SPKSEIRNPKEIRMTKSEHAPCAHPAVHMLTIRGSGFLRASEFGFRAYFGSRASSIRISFGLRYSGFLRISAFGFRISFVIPHACAPCEFWYLELWQGRYEPLV